MRRIPFSPLACILLLSPACALAQTPLAPSPSSPVPVSPAQQEPSAAPVNPQIETQRAAPPDRRIPNQKNSTLSSLQGIITDQSGRPVPAIQIRLEGPVAASAGSRAITSGDGIFRLLRVPAGTYDLIFTRRDGLSLRQAGVKLNPGEVLSIEVRIPAGPDVAATPLTPEAGRGARRRLLQGAPAAARTRKAPSFRRPSISRRRRKHSTSRPSATASASPSPTIAATSKAKRPTSSATGTTPSTANILKGDRNLFGKYFFSFTGDAITAAEGRRLPVPAGQSTADPGEVPFFGRGGQFFIAETLRMTFDFFHGDTLAFRPVDFRFHIQPAISLNYLNARENQVVNADVPRRNHPLRYQDHTAAGLLRVQAA